MRLVLVALLGVVLTGCTSAGWDHSFAFLDTPQPPPPQARAVAAPDPNWCSEAAAAAKTETAEHGFDAATQQRRSETILAQCQRGR